ncbi:MAG TPA: antibiotic biosynthesis monooxygenase [Arachidicoccus sp.]
MITEIAILKIKQNQSKAFLISFAKAEKIIASSQGYISHKLQKCIEQEDKFLLMVKWQTLENHTEGFRESEAYLDWKKLLHHYYEPFPEVEHYTQL